MCGRTVMVVAFSMLLFPLHPALALSGETSNPVQHDNPIIMYLEISDGLVTSEDVIIFGFLENEDIPISVWWELSDSSGIRLTGTLTELLSLVEGEFDRYRWEFQFTISANIVLPCACNLIVYAQEKSEDTVDEVRSIFFYDDIELLSPTIFIESNLDWSWASDVVKIQGHSHTISGNEPMLSYTISVSPNSKCSTDPDVLIQSSTVLDQTHSLNWGNGSFSASIDVSSYIDGWYDIIIFSSESDVSLLAHYCISVRVDNSPPIPSIIGPDSVIEGLGIIIFDGSETDDHHWDNSGIFYIWTLRHISQSGSIPVEVSSGYSVRDFSVNISTSGLFEVSLTVLDQAGNTATLAKQFSIENIHPEARLEIDGKSIFDGESLRMSKTTSIQIDASNSIDTDNDESTLRFVWRVNNVPVYEGSFRELSWPDNIDDEFYLALEVIDNDDDSSILTIHVIDSDAGSPFPNSLIILLLSFIFFTYALLNTLRHKSSEDQIPKWV